MVTFDEKEKYLNKEFHKAAEELVYYPSVMGTKYYEGNTKFYEKLKMSSEARKRYIGKKVYAGSRMKGYYGIIVDVIPDEDGYDDWFVVQEDDNPRHFENWGKEELQQIIITTTLAPLK